MHFSLRIAIIAMLLFSLKEGPYEYKRKQHLTLGERIAIAKLLVQNKLLNEISEAINKDARTISKEIKRNRQEEINKKYKYTKGYPGLDCSLEKMALLNKTLTEGTKKVNPYNI